MRNSLLISLFLVLLAYILINRPLPATREQRAEAYLSEFSSQAFKESYPKIYYALKAVMVSLPPEAFEKVSNRAFPILFTEVPHTGTGQWANSSGIYVLPNDPPTFTKGMWITKLSTHLNEAKDIEAIEGVIFHEIAHFILGHQGGEFSKDIEKQANAQVKKWGFERHFLKAKAEFGSQSPHTQSPK